MAVQDGVNIAILGGTGHIAKNLIVRWSLRPEYRLLVFAREPERVRLFLHDNKLDAGTCSVHGIEEFGYHDCDVVVNCIGIGNPAKLREIGGSILRLTEYYDDLVLDYSAARRGCLYIHFSSGAAYGTDFSCPAGRRRSVSLDINNVTASDYYTVSKLNAEVKHRGHPGLNIVDLRIFGFFSRFIDTEAPFLLSELVRCARDGVPFCTNSDDLVRDFIHPDDLTRIVDRCIAIRRMNDAFDVYSSASVTKKELIAFFEKRYGLRAVVAGTETETEANRSSDSVTGIKTNYYSESRKLEQIGFVPAFSSLEAIADELVPLLGLPGS